MKKIRPDSADRTARCGAYSYIPVATTTPTQSLFLYLLIVPLRYRGLFNNLNRSLKLCSWKKKRKKKPFSIFAGV